MKLQVLDTNNIVKIFIVVHCVTNKFAAKIWLHLERLLICWYAFVISFDRSAARSFSAADPFALVSG